MAPIPVWPVRVSARAPPFRVVPTAAGNAGAVGAALPGFACARDFLLMTVARACFMAVTSTIAA
jgi:hypothetical protein